MGFRFFSSSEAHLQPLPHRSRGRWGWRNGRQGCPAPFVGRVDCPSRQCLDAHLAATALVQGQRLVCLDADVERFPGLHWLQLEERPPPL
ncbi:MAG: hypothetical protein ER33_12630 [Cyanobium sp. CACIAM 14]|nr:MAG: hypothetical protein ER33_12630 [Cyanobium sp. CACIAM 14]